MSGSDEDKSSKTQQATEQKLRKAREKGDVPISKEVGALMSYLAILCCLMIFAPKVAPHFLDAFADMFRSAPQLSSDYGASGLADLYGTVRPLIRAAVYVAAGCMAIMIAAGIIGAVVQGPFLFSRERIMPKLNKITPMKGLKRIFSGQNLFEFGKSLVKLTMLILVALWLIWGLMDQITPGGAVNIEDVPMIIGAEATSLLIFICVLMLPIVLVDYVVKRMMYNRKQMMSMKELKDEHKESDGDPMIKAKRDQIRRGRLRQLILTGVPQATLIVTNPTHFAVALRYNRGVDVAPVCVAKGADLMAKKIRQIAHENEIPVIESRALARSLYARVEVDDQIPEEHWEQVAQLVRFVFDLKRKIRSKPPEGAVLRDD